MAQPLSDSQVFALINTLVASLDDAEAKTDFGKQVLASLQTELLRHETVMLRRLEEGPAQKLEGQFFEERTLTFPNEAIEAVQDYMAREHALEHKNFNEAVLWILGAQIERWKMIAGEPD